MSAKSHFTVSANGALNYVPILMLIDHRKVLSNYENWFEVICEAPGYKTEEIEIVVQNQIIEVKGKKEGNSFAKEFPLEEGVTADSLVCGLWNSSGILIISAPVQKEQQQVRKVTATLANSDITPVGNPTAIFANRERTKPADWKEVTPNYPVSSTPRRSTYVDFDRKQGGICESTSEGHVIHPCILEQEDEDHPSIANDPRFEDVSQFVCLESDEQGVEVFGICFEMPEYNPQEINISITQRVLTIMAKHESTVGLRTSRRKMFKKFTLPEGTTHNDVSCVLTNEILKVSVMRTKEAHLKKTPVAKIDISAIEDVLRKRQGKVCDASGKIVDEVGVFKGDNMLPCKTPSHSRTSPRSIKANIVSAESLKNYNFDKAEPSFRLTSGSNIFSRTCQVDENYTGDDISIKMCYGVRDRSWIIIEGAKQRKSFSEMFTVPPGCKLENVVAVIDAQNLITVKVPLPNKQTTLS